MNSQITNLEELKMEQNRLKSLIQNKEVELEYQLTNAVSTKTVKEEVFSSVRNSTPLLGELLKATISTKLIKTISKLLMKKVVKLLK